METVALCQIEIPQVRVRPSLLRSIRERGILYPILLTQVNDLYLILDGRRRAAAARALGLEAVPAVVIEGGPEVTILTHATRSENPVAELEAIRELMSEGLSEKEIAAAGFAELGRIRRLARLNHLVRPVAERVENGEIAPGVAFEIAALPADLQRRLAAEEKVTGEAVRQAKMVRRRAEQLPSLEGLLSEAGRQVPPASFDQLLGHLSAPTLGVLRDDLPGGEEYAFWRRKIEGLLERKRTLAAD
jgi:ParB/RepB/Spo0J family partition protein